MKKKILICDDEAGVRDALSLILEQDYDLDFASNGDEAIAKLKGSSYDGMLLDIKMPEKDGLETIKEAKNISPNTRIIIVTGYQSVATATKAVKLGASDYITKPFEEDEVREKVSRV